MLYRYLLLPSLVFIMVLSSCSSKMSLTKRRYMKGYHVDFAKNKTTKPDPTKEQATVLKKIIPPKIITTQKEELYACKTEKTALNKNKVSNSNAAFVKNKKYKSLGNISLNVSVNQANTNKHNLLKALNKSKTRLTKSVKTNGASKRPGPFDYFFNNGNGNFGMGLLYILVSIVAVVLMYFLFALFFGALVYGLIFPTWLTGLLVIIGIIVLAAVIFVVVVNGD